MILEEDKEFLNNPDYNLPLEKFYMETHSGREENYYLINDNDNGTISKAYPFSNEDLKRFFSKRDLTGKRVLTVGSSGDQLLNCILAGADKVTVIDGNIYARPYIEYKLAAMQTMGYKEFKHTFFSGEIFHWQTYQKISHLMSDEVKPFWDQLFLSVESGERESLFLTHCLLNKDLRDGQVRSMFYIDANVYKTLQKLIPACQVDYKVSTFEDFPAAVEGEKYDMIYLSNIKKYIPNSTYRSVVYNLHDNNLKPGGEMVVNYSFKHDFYSFYESESVDEVLRRLPVEETQLKGDTIYTVTKPIEQEGVQSGQTQTCAPLLGSQFYGTLDACGYEQLQ